MRYSTGVKQEKFSKLSLVLMTEFLKLFTCTVAMQLSNSSPDNQYQYKKKNLIPKMLFLIKSSGYTWIPALCYFIQNNLTIYASQNLTSHVFAVLQQLKIFSAAICSVTLLGRHLNYRQWRALLLLVIGAVLMEYHTFEIKFHSKNINDPIKGSIYMLIIVTLSGFAGVITEKLMKNKMSSTKSELNSMEIGTNDGRIGDEKKSDVYLSSASKTPPLSSNIKNRSKVFKSGISVGNQPMMGAIQFSIWERNIQMAFWSVFFGIIGIFMDGDWITNNGGFFHDWSFTTVILVVLMTCGGLLVALTLKYTDVVVKGFASAISLIFICLGGSFFLEDYLDMIFIIGACVTVIASFNYNDRESGSSVLDSKLVVKGNGSGKLVNVSMVNNGGREKYIMIDANEDEIQPMIHRHSHK